MLMVDLCSGLGGASQAMKDRGWQVTTVDNDPRFKPDIIADVRTFTWNGERPTLIWASPPCHEFTRAFLPWIKSETVPDMSIVQAVCRIIYEANPVYWVIENVRGAQKYFGPVLGEPAYILSGVYFLWGHFPDLSLYGTYFKIWHRDKALRAKIPYELSNALATAIEEQWPLFQTHYNQNLVAFKRIFMV